ncbi:MAG: 4Fe-4S dicluster domain-containing protein, partial [Desulfobacterales bacterium]|nr:4Fe-4S dicluster domain-containing protein [Desulfobacterales bacterium]
QSIKYWLLIFLLTAAMADLIFLLAAPLQHGPRLLWILILIVLAVATFAAGLKVILKPEKTLLFLSAVLGIWLLANFLLQGPRAGAASLQTGLLDPIPLLHRSINLVLLPLMDGALLHLSASRRFYTGAGLIGVFFMAALFLNLLVPRFYCRFVCPLGALFGILGRFAIFRMGKRSAACPDCHLCELHCEGGCTPSGRIRIAECILCMNCRDGCRHDQMGYRIFPSATGEMTSPDISRRQFVVTLLSGAVAIPMLRLSGDIDPNWNPQLVRPPGALSEKDFLSRCIKCGQCMRICPTNVIQPASLEAGPEGLWTPALNFRVGSSGCQLNCIACGHICPTGAIRPVSLEEKLGTGAYAGKGPLRLGTAFVDRGRCLPWAMDTPCIVCQENCPVSPKAIFTREQFNTVLETDLAVRKSNRTLLELEKNVLVPGKFATGDYYCSFRNEPDSPPRLIVENTAGSITVSAAPARQEPPAPGTGLKIQIRLLNPHVRLEYCIGCGICEHECPVRGKRAIRVTGENESRNKNHLLLL